MSDKLASAMNIASAVSAVLAAVAAAVATKFARDSLILQREQSKMDAPNVEARACATVCDTGPAVTIRAINHSRRPVHIDTWSIQGRDGVAHVDIRTLRLSISVAKHQSLPAILNEAEDLAIMIASPFPLIEVSGVGIIDRTNGRVWNAILQDFPQS